MIGCVIAMESEAQILKEQMHPCKASVRHGKNIYVGQAFGEDVLLIVTGEGKVNAAAGTMLAIERGADVLLNFGVAGGLNDKTKVANVYLVENCVQYDFDLTQLSGGKIGTLPGEKDNLLPLCCPTSLSFPRRVLGTGDRFNDSKDDHELLLSLGCSLRDMEGGAIAQVARNADIPLVSVKAVSDVYGSGSTTAQFEQNLAYALCKLKDALKEVFFALKDLHKNQAPLEKIASFQKDHDRLQVGFYASEPQNGVTTFDLRFKKPNAGDYLTPESLHSIEHLLATTLRNSEKKEHIVYFGPMGCRTGFYLLTTGLGFEEVRALLQDCIRRALTLDTVPGSGKKECGNYLSHDLEGAKEELKKYIEVLKTV